MIPPSTLKIENAGSYIGFLWMNGFLTDAEYRRANDKFNKWVIRESWKQEENQNDKS